MWYYISTSHFDSQRWLELSVAGIGMTLVGVVSMWVTYYPCVARHVIRRYMRVTVTPQCYIIVCYQVVEVRSVAAVHLVIDIILSYT